MALEEIDEEQGIKYLWYCVGDGLSDDFDTEEECILDAYKENIKYPSEYGIYCYNSLEFPNGDVDIDDCNYLGFVGQETFSKII